MARTRAAAKTSTINRASGSSPELERYCRGLEGWPRSWMGWEKDLPPGERLVVCFRPFLEQLVGSELAPRTIQNHVDNLWALGGEIIRDLNEDLSLSKTPVERLLREAVRADGGPMLHNGSEEEQRSFDSTCRRFHRFLSHTEPARAPRREKASRRKSRP